MRRSDLIAVGTILGLAGAVCAPADGEPKSPQPVAAPVPVSPESPAEAGKKVELASSDLGGLDALLPVGKTARKVVIPGIDEDGILTSVTRMGRITRTDEDHFALDNVLLTFFDAEKIDPATGKPETTKVKISKGIYISSEKKLVSDRPARISKPGLEMTGDTLVYWSVPGHAVLRGNTELILTGLTAPAPAPDPDEPAAADAVPAEGSRPESDPTGDPRTPAQPNPQ